MSIHAPSGAERDVHAGNQNVFCYDWLARGECEWLEYALPSHSELSPPSPLFSSMLSQAVSGTTPEMRQAALLNATSYELFVLIHTCDIQVVQRKPGTGRRNAIASTARKAAGFRDPTGSFLAPNRRTGPRARKIARDPCGFHLQFSVHWFRPTSQPSLIWYCN